MTIRRKKYKSRREKLNRDMHNLKLMLLFGSAALLIILVKNRKDIYDWFVITFWG